MTVLNHDTSITVVIPALNEVDNLPPLIDEIHAALAGPIYEIIVVDDASTDATPQVMARICKADPRVKTVRHPRTMGRSAGVFTGVRHASGQHIATMDGDGQNDPSFLPALLAPLSDPAIGLVAGQRLKHRHPWSKRLGSHIANRVRRGLLRDSTRDTACGLKAFRRDTYLELPYFDTMHRFLPALFLADDWRVAHIDVVDRPRSHGRSKYTNFGRLLEGVPDLFGVWWLRRRRRSNPAKWLRNLDRQIRQ